MRLTVLLTIAALVSGCGKEEQSSETQKATPPSQVQPAVQPAVPAQPVVADPLKEYDAYRAKFLAVLADKAKEHQPTFGDPTKWEPKEDVQKTSSLMTPYVGVLKIRDIIFWDKEKNIISGQDFDITLKYERTKWKFGDVKIEKFIGGFTDGQPKIMSRNELRDVEKEVIEKAMNEAGAVAEGK